jgi:AcrR family transcriptional regulator
MSAQTGPRKGNKGTKTRHDFLQAGRRVFVRDGYVNAEISEISKEAGKSSGGFYIYFENKPALLKALLAEFHANLDARFEEHDDRWYALSTQADWHLVIENIWESFKTDGPTLQALAQAAQVDDHFAEEYENFRQRVRTDFTNFLKARQKLGFCRTISIPYVAAALETMILHCMNEWLSEGGKCRNRREEKKALGALKAVFGAMMSVD